MSIGLRAALAASFVLTCVGVASARHEDDPKLLSRRPAHHARPIRTLGTVGQSIQSAGTLRSFGSLGVTLLSQLPLTSFNASSGNDCWGYTSPSGREYALFGHSDGTGVVEVTDPRNPVIVVNLAGPNSLWRDIKVFDHYAYVVSEGGSGIQVFDLASIDAGSVPLVNTITTGGATSTHNVAIDTASGYLYRCGGGSNVGIRIYDLNANPAAPTYVGQWTTLYVHDCQVVSYTSGPYAGKQIAFCCAGTGNGSGATRLTILDVTNKASISVLRDVYWPTAAYSHQCWLSEDLRYCYVDDELDEPNLPSTTYVVDVSNLAGAFLVGNFTNGNTAITHNLYTVGNRIFAANYRSGMRVFDATNPTSPVEIAYFDTFTQDDSAQFNGLWSVYPYFASGTVIGSDLESGLFVWWVGDPLLDLSLAQPAPQLINPGGATLGAQIVEAQPGTLVAGSAKLNYDVGAGLAQVDLVDHGNGNFDVPFPALPCGSTVSSYLSAQSTTGMTWTYPAAGAAEPLTATVALGVTTVAQSDMETNPGWSVGDTGDNATTGIWVRADPVGTAAQPEDDHSAAGTLCWVTGNGSPGGAVGTADVDGGTTTLKTALYDLTGYSDPVVGYWRWYSNDQGVIDDEFTVDVTNGGPWVRVETLGPTGSETHGGWYYHEFRVSSFVTPSASVQLRFKASDTGTGSIVEAAIDDFQIRDVDCSLPTSYCTAGLSTHGCTPQISAAGSASASSPSGFLITVAGLEGQQSGVIFYGVSGASASAWGSGTSFMCVKAPLQRTSPQGSGGTADACDGQFALDWNGFVATHPTAIGAPFSAGQSVWAQGWYRDPPAPKTTNLSDGLEFTVGP